MRFFLPISIVFLVLTLAGCEKGNVFLDNAGESMRKVEIDNQSFSIEPKGSVILTLKPGAYPIKVKNGGDTVIKDTQIFVGKKGGVVNLGQRRYILWKELYGDTTNKAQKLQIQKIDYDKMMYIGDFTNYDSSVFYIPCTWNYNLDEVFPDGELNWTPPNKERYELKSKIYRIEQFAAEFKKEKH